ncbi:hypothetical protein GCM10010517_56800 [Streptosporangium fragile]|uniref:Transposase IS701-like DDE domain-containing protein n=1 Tax=Streptosporangium fragile TaxID=46186 RepID=A0ABN3W4F9_9ACTN
MLRAITATKTEAIGPEAWVIVSADAGYGQSAAFRHALRIRDLEYIPPVRG